MPAHDSAADPRRPGRAPGCRAGGVRPAAAARTGRPCSVPDRPSAGRRIGPAAAVILLCAGLAGACGPSSDGAPAPVAPGSGSDLEAAEATADETRDDGDVSAAAPEPEPEPPAPDAGGQAGAPADGDDPAAGPTQVAALPPAPAPEARPAGVVDPSTARGNRLRVGVLLPLSGAYAATGRELFQAAEMALFEADAAGVELLPRDTAGDADTARAAFLELAADGVGLVVGPLFAWTAEAVVPEAANRGIPVLALSNDVSVAGRDAWMLGVHPRGEVRRILRHVLAAPDQRVGLIAPETGYGNAVVEAYELEVAPRNRSGLIRYREDSEPRAVVQQFVDRVPGAVNRAGDAILIAARGHALRAMAAELAYRNVPPDRVRYLGLSSWRTSDLQGEPALVGGRFADVPEGAFRRFAARFRGIYGTPPSRTAALAYDAAAVAAHLAAVDPGRRPATLQAPQGFRGLLGAFRLLPDGVVERGFDVYEVGRDGYSLLEPAPARFAGDPPG